MTITAAPMGSTNSVAAPLPVLKQIRADVLDADIWADMPTAQLLTGYVDVDGLKFPTRRRAYHRLDDGTPDLSRNYVAIDLSDYALLADG